MYLINLCLEKIFLKNSKVKIYVSCDYSVNIFLEKIHKKKKQILRKF